MAHRKSTHLRQTGRRLLEALKIRYHLWSEKAPPWHKTFLFFLTVLGSSGLFFVILKKRRLTNPRKKITGQPIQVGFYREMIKILEARPLWKSMGPLPSSMPDG